MPALTVVITGDAKKLEAEMAKINALAARTGQNIRTSLSGSGVAGGGTSTGTLGNHGAIRESMVLIRELARGDLKRASQSASILVDRLGLMKYVLNPVTGIVLGLVAGFAAAYKLTGYLVDKLSGLKLPELHPEYIAKHLQKLGQIAEAHREIGKEVDRTVELYNSAAKAAERLSRATKEQFDHERKMNEYAEQKELAKARSEKERRTIRQKYSDMDLDLQKREHEADIKAMQDEKSALEKESISKSEQADAITGAMPSREADKNTLEYRKKQAEEAQKYLDDMAKNPKGTIGDKIARAYNAVALSGVSGNDLDAARRANGDEARRRIKSYQDFQDEIHEREVQRKRAEELNKDAAESAKKATELGLSIPDQQKANAQKEADAKAEAAAKLDAEASQGRLKNLHGNVTELQKLGAYTSPSSMALININRSMDHKLGKIEGHLAKIGGGFGNNRSSVKF